MIKPLITQPMTANQSQTRIDRPTVKTAIPAQSEEQRLQKACKAFESLFINYLFKEMRATVDQSDLIDGGQAEAITTSMLDASMSEELAERGGIGLADMLLRQLESRLQPDAQAGTAPAKPSNRPKQ